MVDGAVTPRLLRRHVGQRAGSFGVASASSRAEIDEDGFELELGDQVSARAAPSEQDVRRLDVTMDQAAFVGIAQCTRYEHTERGRLAHAERSVPLMSGEVEPFEPLHAEVRPPEIAQRPGIPNAHDAWV